MEKINGLTVESYVNRSVKSYIFKKTNGIVDASTVKWDKHLESLRTK